MAISQSTRTLALCVSLLFAVPVQAQTLPTWTAHTTLSALLSAEKDRIMSLPVNSFKPLSEYEVFAAGDALRQLMAGSLAGVPFLEAIGYKAYEFNPSNGKRYVVLREPRDPIGPEQFRGLGIVVIDRAPTTNVMIHAKHIGSDVKSHITSRMFFEDLGAVALIWTGVRRCNSNEISPCLSATKANPICGGFGERISDASRYNKNVITASTLAAQARDAIVLDIHSNSTEPRAIVISTGGPVLYQQPAAFFPNRVRTLLLASGLAAGSCDAVDDAQLGMTYCGRFVQQKMCNGLSTQEACGPMIPAFTSGRYLQVELRSSIYGSTQNTRAVIAAFRTELP